MKNVLITTGDADGIGFEITAKALANIGPKKGIQFYYFRHPDSEKKYLRLIKKKFDVISVDSLESALSQSKNKNQIFEIYSSKNPALCFETGVLAAKKKLFSAIVTAPMSKELIHTAGLSDRGHTDIIRRIFPEEKKISMAFMGDLFSLILATDHVPLKDVPAKITPTSLSALIDTAWRFFDLLKTPKSKREIGVLGLNPHAGEIKNLGSEEQEIILPAIIAARQKGIRVAGPLVGDVCFQSPQYKKFPLYIAMYHDQGLIPFKMLHKKNHGIQISLNAPFVRVSVDHGCAKDIFGKNRADPSSMIRAIQTALKIV